MIYAWLDRTINKFEFSDFKRAAIITLSATLAVGLSLWWQSPQSMWAVLIAALITLGKVGATPWQRHISLLLMGVAATVGIAIMSVINNKIALVLPWIFISTIVLYLLPRYYAGSQLTGIFILIFMIFAHSMPVDSWSALEQQALAVLAGTIIATVVNVAFDHETINVTLVPDKSLHFLQRAIRMASILTFIAYVCYNSHFQSFAWIATSAIVVDQHTLGATVKKASQRILGTIFGVAIGILLAHYIFAYYPESRILALVFLFMLFFVLRQSYTLAIFFATLLLSILFYFLASSQITIVSFMLSRISDTLIGIIISIVGASIIFPKSLFYLFRHDLINFWRGTENFILLFGRNANYFDGLQDLNQQLEQVKQDLKDFWYEPNRIFFRRYYHCVILVDLANKLLKTFVYLPSLQQQLPPALFQSALMDAIVSSTRLLVEISNNVNAIALLDSQIEYLSKSAEQLKDVKHAVEVLHDTQAIMILYKDLLKIPRWRIELAE